MTHRRLLYALLIVYLVLGITYSVTVPIFEVSDELWHYPMVKYLADNGLRLPPQDPANPGPWRQEGSQPPLYYMLAAVLTAGIDTSDMDVVRRINPHADIGIMRPDGNANMMVHRPGAETFPWQGTVLAVQIIRLFSLILGLGTIIVTYLLAREIFPETPIIALGAAALNAFLPMFLFISASVNNDNLSNLLGNLLTLQIVRLVKTRTLPNWREYALIGVVAGGGLLSKLNIAFLIPLVGLALFIISLRLKNWRPLVIGGLISGGITIAAAGWWYWHNYQLYGDPSGINRFLEMVGRRAIPANLAQLWSERHSFTQAYWGFFGGVNVALPEIVYLVFNIIGGLGLVSAAVFVIHTLLRQQWSFQRWLPAAITIIWPVVSFVSYLRWTSETQASQGRLLFAALSSITVWMVVGWVWWVPARFKAVLTGGVAAYFGMVALLTPFLVIEPAYRPPAFLPPSAERLASFSEVNGSGELVLTAGAVGEAIQPESYAVIDLRWQVGRPLSRDWSLFVHLVTPDGVIVGQRDVYPGGGKLATSDLRVGDSWDNPVAIWVPLMAYAPMTLDVVVGWYDLKTGERLRQADGSETYPIGELTLQPRPDRENLAVPNPIRVNFDNQLQLVGYGMSDLSPAAGENFTVTLYWRATQPIPVDYKVFVNIIDPPTLTKYASSDAMPANWQAPTSTWQVGQIIEDAHTMTVDPNAPPGIFEVQIGLYRQMDDGGFQRLRIVTPDGGMADDFIYLNRVRIVPAGQP